MLQTLSVLQIFRFLSWLFDHVGKQLNKKTKVNFETCDVQTEKQVIAIQILPNILRSKDNQTAKFCQLKEYNMRNVFQAK